MREEGKGGVRRRERRREKREKKESEKREKRDERKGKRRICEKRGKEMKEEGKEGGVTRGNLPCFASSPVCSSASARSASPSTSRTCDTMLAVCRRLSRVGSE